MEHLSVNLASKINECLEAEVVAQSISREMVAARAINLYHHISGLVIAGEIVGVFSDASRPGLVYVRTVMHGSAEVIRRDLGETYEIDYGPGRRAPPSEMSRHLRIVR